MSDHAKIYHANGRRQIDRESPVSAFPGLRPDTAMVSSIPHLRSGFKLLGPHRELTLGAAIYEAPSLGTDIAGV